MRQVFESFVRFLDATPNPKQRLPRVIQFPINDICNSRCQMCHIWQQKKSFEISPEQIRTLLKNPLFRKVQGVGINGGEPTLRKDIREVAESVAISLPSLKSLSLITNAIRGSQVKDAIDSIGGVCKIHHLHFDVMVSLDGIGKVHDRVRGMDGNFESAIEVLQYAKASKNVSSVRIGCTIIKENIFDVENVLHWALDQNIYARFRVGIPHQRLYVSDLKAPFQLNDQELFHLANFLDILYLTYEKNEARRHFYRSLRDQMIYQKPRTSGCVWKNAGVTLSSRGEFAYCAVQSKALGNVLQDDPNDLFWKNSEHLQEIVRNKCASCLHDYDGIASRSIWMKDVWAKNKRRLPGIALSALQKTKQKWENFKDYQELKKQTKTVKIKAMNRLNRSKKTNRVLVCGWYGTETLGDKAILAGLTHCLRLARPDLQIDIASLEPYVTRNTAHQMPELNPNSILFHQEAITQLETSSYDSLIIGGGPLMSGIRESLDLLKLVAMAKSKQTPVMIAGCGVGPLKNDVAKKAIEEILSLSDEIIFRDQSSKILAEQELKLSQTPKVALDPAFLWVHQNHKESNRSRRLILALREWPRDYQNSSKMQPLEAQNHFENEIRKLISLLKDQVPDMEIYPFCMHKYAKGGDDRAYYRKIFKNEPELNSKIPNQHRPPDEDLSLFSTSQYILAMRFHSLVFALGTQTPYSVIDYTRGGKIRALSNDLRIQDNVEDLEDFKAQKTLEKILQPTSKIPDLKNEIYQTEKVFVDLFRQI